MTTQNIQLHITKDNSSEPRETDNLTQQLVTEAVSEVVANASPYRQALKSLLHQDYNTFQNIITTLKTDNIDSGVHVLILLVKHYKVCPINIDTTSLSPPIELLHYVDFRNRSYNIGKEQYWCILQLLHYKETVSPFLFDPKLLEQKYSYQNNVEHDHTAIPVVLSTPVLAILQKYYHHVIHKKKFVLGDRQSNRYKSHNEIIQRIIHVELYPLVQYIIGKPIKPSYTYFSGYIKGATLPSHADRIQCEYSVSILIDQDPKNLVWPIYVEHAPNHGLQGGRKKTPSCSEECVGLTCQLGGLILFRGRHHYHFRNPLEGNFAYYFLLHYVDDDFEGVLT